MDLTDDRKSYFLNLLCVFFELENKDDSLENCNDDESLNCFLNDISCNFLRVSAVDGSFKFTNEIPSDDCETNNQIVFFKTKPESLTKETIKTSVIITTLFGSPISTFYHALNNFYVPALLSHNIGQEAQVQNTLKILDYKLKHALVKSKNDESLVITSVNEEIKFWESVAVSAESVVEKENAKAIWEVLSSVENDFSSLEGLMNVDLEDIIESCSSMLDDLWRIEPNAYEQKRMEKLIEMAGNSIALYIQKKVDALDVWKDDFDQVRDILNMGITACEKWNDSLRTLCTVYWAGSNDRRWTGDPIVHELCLKLQKRLTEIKNVRSSYRQLTRLLSSSEQKELRTSASFAYFKGLKPTMCGPYTERLWEAALMQFDKSLHAVEHRVSSKLKTQLNHLNANTLQLLQELKRYQELIKRQNIAQHLVPERQNLLGVLQEYVDGIIIDDEQDFPLLDLPPTVNKIYWARVLESKIKEINEANNEILSDLKGSATLDDSCKSLLKQLNDFEKKQFEQWAYKVKEDIRRKELTLSETSKVLHLKAGQMVEVNYNSRLVRLVSEVQQLSLMGLVIPRAIKEVSDRAVKFMNQAKALEQIANFHNTIGDRIIPCQKPMLLPAAQELDSLINSQQTVTWTDTAAVDKYIESLQEVVERLSKENNKLAFYHQKICDKVTGLMSADIIRQQNFWKQGLRDIREIISQVETMKFPNMKSWKLHWDYQLYKALEGQYKLSLCNLHLHFPEMKVELTYRQQKLQFNPPMEEIRMKYYSQVKKFLSIPSSFTGISENTNRLFSTIIIRNAFRFEEVFIEAENLFERLERVKKDWAHWMALGGLNLENMAEENLNSAEDWDLNFRASKNVGQEIAKLPYNDEKIGCITVSVLPVRAEMELHNRRYWDALVISLQTSILRDVSNLNKFIADATEILNAQPKTISEVGEANMKHVQLVESSVEMQTSFEFTLKKNKTLASWTKDKIEQVNQLVFAWDNFQNSLQNHKSQISKQVERMKTALKGETENLLSEMEKFTLRWEVQRPKDTDIQDANSETLRKNVKLIKEKIEEWNLIRSKKQNILSGQARLRFFLRPRIRNDRQTCKRTDERMTDYWHCPNNSREECKKFDMPEPDLGNFQEINQELENYESIWCFYDEFHSQLNELGSEEWILFRGKTYRLDEFLSCWEKKVEEKPASSVTVRMLQEINSYKAVVPLLKYLRGEMFSDKHWLELFMMLGMNHTSPETLTLGDILVAKDRIIISDQNLQALNNEAASEITIRQALGELDAWEVQARFILTSHSDSQNKTLMLIKDFSDILNKIGDNQCLLQSVINSPNSKSFLERTSIWDNKLTNLDEYVSNLNVVQRKWVYLEPIFRNGSFAKERARFERVDQDFRYIMNEVSKDNRVVALFRIVNLKQTLDTLIDQLTRCQNSLNQYLQEKRCSFARFYFLGDEDLLELLGQSTKEKVIQAHLKKLFSNVNRVSMTEGAIKNIKSLQGETVKLTTPVKVTNCIEDWLSSLSTEIKKTLKSLLIQYVAENKSVEMDPLKYPSQILCLGESLWFTFACEEHITNGTLREFHSTLKAKLDFYSGNSVDWNENDNLLQLKLKALLIDAIHHVDIVECLIENRVTGINDWYWQKQLRFYLDHQKNVIVRMVDAEMQYTYEYQGNTPKLVWTPLTEKCFLTLTQAIRMGLGGNPFGPAGTGKTESVKALGGLLGRQVLVFNCDKGIDVTSMGRIFTGLVKCGAWGCFDEFNRLEEATLSAVSMLIQPIQVALQENKTSVAILGEEVNIDLHCGLFVTLNPAGKKYGGRKKLPDNLKQLFRPVVMSVPDEKLIAQVSLLCEGFKEAKVIGGKLVEVFDLSKNLLSKQQHYDWGLRALKTVLGSCGTLFRENRKKTERSSELELAVEAVRFNTLSKLTFTDSKLFDRIVEDVFVGVKFTASGYEKLTHALKSSCEELGLCYNENQIKKCIEVFEQMQQRMGVALVGPSGTGKTTILKLLKYGLQKLGHGVKQCILNPKAMPRTQLFGQVDLDTRQWNEGVLTANAFKIHTESSDMLCWLICDGDIDPDWVEALNSVLDDNRLLTLPSGWRIQFGPNVNFIFETSDLNHASPATVSRMGIIFLSDQIIDVSMVVDSWLGSQPDKIKQFLEPYISDFFYKSIEWIRREGSLVVPYSIVGLVRSGLSHLVDVKDKSHFVISLIYGLGANLTIESREAFAKYVFELAGEYVPDPLRILQCFYNKEKQRIDVVTPDARNDVNKEFSLVLTGTARTGTFVLEPWINSFQPILISGPKGSGKTALISYCLSKLPAIETATVYCSEFITPQHVVQKIRQFSIITTTSTGRVFRPKNSQKLIVFIKNMELASPDAWGTNMLMTWLQQVIMYQGFYDADLEWTSLEKIQIIGTLTDHGSSPAVRLTSIMRIYALSSPSTEDLKTIYSVYLRTVLSQNFEKHRVWNTETKIISLAGTLISIYEKMRSNFTQVRQKHYLFSPRDLTRWCVELQRYKIESGDPVRSLLEVVAYVGLRLFHDKLVSKEDRTAIVDIMQTEMENEWGHGDLLTGIEDIYYVSDESHRFVTKVDRSNWSEAVKKGILMSSGEDSNLFLTDELLRLVSSIDRSLSAPNSLILAGRPGVGRKTALRIVTALHSARLVTLSMSQNYTIKNFKIDLKNAFQQAGIEGETVYLLIEDHQVVDNSFIDMVSSLLSSGEVPGLYNPDELESVISSLRDVAAVEGFSGSTMTFFASRILKNLHVVLLFDFEGDRFKSMSENNSRLFTKCEVIWLAGWSAVTMKIIFKMLFARLVEEEKLKEVDVVDEVGNFVLDIHREVADKCATPRRFLAFVNNYAQIFIAKQNSITKRAEVLRAGVTKLNQTRNVVDNLKEEAAKQEEKLAEKQSKASAALDLIGETMKNANTRKEKMEKLREQAVLESKQLTERKKVIDQELAEVNPLIEEARQAVGNIKNEALSEIRSLRAPPDAIRDILEGVLRLMGIQDTSWNNMKTFLAKRGVKEEIRTFDAHQISPENREAVNELLAERRDSFDSKVAKRASVAAAPLAAWVKANIKYATVLEKIRPLEREQKNLEQNLKNIEDQLGSISTGLGEVDERVSELKAQLNTYTREAAVIEIHLTKAQETMASAQELVFKLEDEYNRWRSQLDEMDDNLRLLPKYAVMAAAFIAYLAGSSENIRRSKPEEWKEKLNTPKFSLVDFLATEQKKLKWISEGLPSDQFSIENCVVMLESWLHPLLIDPNGVVSNWLKNHFCDANLEILSQHSPKLQTNVEFAIRFGKTLVVEDVDEVHPILVPILRKDVISHGPRKIICIGEKSVDYNKDFKMFLVTRNTATNALPDATAISFTVTQQGLAGQLLALAVQQEKPELETERSELLKRQEKMKLKLFTIEENLLQKLATAQGDILANKDLLDSLNQTKTSSEEISKALDESKKLEAELDKECQSYKAIAEFGSRLFFTVKALSELNPMYRFSVGVFKKLFQKSLKDNLVESDNYTEGQKKKLLIVVYQYVSRSLFNSDRLAFALHLYWSAYPEKILPKEWKVLKGEAGIETQTNLNLKDTLPGWIEEDRLFDISILNSAFPQLLPSLPMSAISNWLNFSKSQECEKEIPQSLKSELSSIQTLLIIQAFRPDRLHSAMTKFVLTAMGMKTLSPSCNRLVEIAEESVCNEPILLIVSPGADPSEELRTVAKTLPNVKLREVALGEGQTKAATELLKTCSEEGMWLCLKNLHLITPWLGDLEKEFRSLNPHPDFRLWLTTEPHDGLSPILTESCLKLTYEAPPGIKKNLQRTFSSWSSEMYRRKGVLFGRTIFAAAWFHAVVQERRIFIPQGWSKFYELSDADLRAAVNLITRIFAEASYSIDWTFIHGLLLNAIYGGRMDNDFDVEVLGAYLREFFNESVLNKGENFGPKLTLPSSESYSEYLQLIHQLEDFDKPFLFGLPENIERSWQKIKSSQTIHQLKVLEQSAESMNPDGENWQKTLTPILNLWKKLNQNAGLLELKLSDKKRKVVSEDPMIEFIENDFEFGIRVVHLVHQTLAAINKVIRGLTLPDGEVFKAGKSLLTHQTPSKWQNIWEGPGNPMKYLGSIISKALTLQRLREKNINEVILHEEIDLAVFFQPDRFLKAFKQLSGRKSKIALDEMQLCCKWKYNSRSSNTVVLLKNLQLEGAVFDGRTFAHPKTESPSVTTAPPVAIAYIEKDSIELHRKKEEVVFPLYRTFKRENLLMTLSVPCEGGKDEWYKAGVAFFLKE